MRSKPALRSARGRSRASPSNGTSRHRWRSTRRRLLCPTRSPDLVRDAERRRHRLGARRRGALAAAVVPRALGRAADHPRHRLPHAARGLQQAAPRWPACCSRSRRRRARRRLGARSPSCSLAALAVGTLRPMRRSRPRAAATALVVAARRLQRGRLDAARAPRRHVLGIATGLAVNLVVWPPLRDRIAARRVDDSRRPARRAAHGHGRATCASDTSAGSRRAGSSAPARSTTASTRPGPTSARRARADASTSRRQAPRSASATRGDLGAVLVGLEQAVADTRSMARTIEPRRSHRRRGIPPSATPGSASSAAPATPSRDADSRRGALRSCHYSRGRRGRRRGASRPATGRSSSTSRNILEAMAPVAAAQPVRVRSATRPRPDQPVRLTRGSRGDASRSRTSPRRPASRPPPSRTRCAACRPRRRRRSACARRPTSSATPATPSRARSRAAAPASSACSSGSLEDLSEQRFVESLGRQLGRHDLHMLVVDARGEPERERMLARQLADQLVDGLIVSPLDPSDAVVGGHRRGAPGRHRRRRARRPDGRRGAVRQPRRRRAGARAPARARAPADRGPDARAARRRPTGPAERRRRRGVRRARARRHGRQLAALDRGRDRGRRRAARARPAPDRGVLPLGLDRLRRLRGGGRARAGDPARPLRRRLRRPPDRARRLAAAHAAWSGGWPTSPARPPACSPPPSRRRGRGRARACACAPALVERARRPLRGVARAAELVARRPRPARPRRARRPRARRRAGQRGRVEPQRRAR